MKLCMRLCAAILAAGALTAAAEEQPWTLESSNWEKGKDLLPEPVVKRLQKGEYWFKVVSADPSRFHHNYSQAFWDATEKNAGRYGLDEKTCGLKDKATDQIPDYVVALPPPRAARELRLALGPRGRPRHLRRRPQLLRREGRVLRVEAGGRADHPGPPPPALPLPLEVRQPDAPADRHALHGRRLRGAERQGRALVDPAEPRLRAASGVDRGGAVERSVLQLRQGHHVFRQGDVPHLLEAGAQPGWRVLLHRHVRLPLRQERRDLLCSLPEPGGGRERQDEPRRARRPLPELVPRAELGPVVLLAAHAHPHDRLMRRLAIVLGALLLAAPARAADAAGAQVLEHKGRWESGYGAQFYNVVGRLKNTSGHELRYVKLRIEALDEHRNVVARTETYNESAEALAVPDLNPEELLKSGKVKPLPADAEERFRGSFLKEETPPFTDYRVKVIETPEATPRSPSE